MTGNRIHVLDLAHEGRTLKRIWQFHCPGCGYGHGFHDDGRWTFNGNLERPTFAPSLLINGHDPKTRCHSFVRDGRIEFLSDCHHSLAGQTVDLPPVEA